MRPHRTGGRRRDTIPRGYARGFSPRSPSPPASNTLAVKVPTDLENQTVVRFRRESVRRVKRMTSPWQEATYRGPAAPGPRSSGGHPASSSDCSPRSWRLYPSECHGQFLREEVSLILRSVNPPLSRRGSRRAAIGRRAPTSGASSLSSRRFPARCPPHRSTGPGARRPDRGCLR
jgi:hypothetical protein